MICGTRVCVELNQARANYRDVSELLSSGAKRSPTERNGDGVWKVGLLYGMVIPDGGALDGRGTPGRPGVPRLQQGGLSYSSWSSGLPSGPTWISDFLPFVCTTVS